MQGAVQPGVQDCAGAPSSEMGIKGNGLSGVPHLPLCSSVLEGHSSGHLPSHTATFISLLELALK